MYQREKTEQKVQQHLKSIKADLISLGSSKSSEDTLIKCSCGKQEHQSVHYILKGKAGCKQCRKELMHRNQSKAKTGKTAHNKKTTESYKQELKSVNSNMECLEEYVDSDTPILHYCKKCGTEKEYRPLNLLRFGCFGCNGNPLKTLNEYNQELIEKGIQFKAFSYKGAAKRTKHKCLKCGTCIRIMPTNMLKIPKHRTGRCPKCDLASSIYTIEIKDRIFRVRGFERFAVKPLVKHFGLKNVVCDLDGDIPRIKLQANKEHKPDFYIPSENLMVEVKSPATCGLTKHNTFKKKPADIFKQIQKKKKNAIEQGYRYLLLLIDYKGEQIKMPKNWEYWTRKDILDFTRSNQARLR